MDDLQAFIDGWINYSRGDFINAYTLDLVHQFMDETDTDLSYDTIYCEISWAQRHC